MGKFLGIHYDYWHGILGFLVVVVFSVLAAIVSDVENPALRAVESIIIGYFIALGLQGINEAWQGKKAVNVKQLIAWQVNTRKDWKWFFYGSFLGVFVAGILIATIL